MADKRILRLLDANANRAKEALRVCEDIARFVLDSPSLTRRLKKLRHEVSHAVALIPKPYRILVREREPSRDVGKRSRIRFRNKLQIEDIFVANFKRAQEALRVLEEFSRLFSERVSQRFQALRFKLYVVEKRALQEF